MTTGPDAICIDHDWLDGECQTCGLLHPEDCVRCPGRPGMHEYLSRANECRMLYGEAHDEHIAINDECPWCGSTRDEGNQR